MAPLSPDLAAAREGGAVDFEALVKFSREAIRRNDGILFIEGVGGVMTPVTVRHTVLDWVAALRIPAILVAGSYLGTISHTLAALEALRGGDVDVMALVISETGGGTVSMADTAESIGRFARGIPLIALSHPAKPEEFAALAGLFRATDAGRSRPQGGRAP
jgi:dethiobiotin synthetase